MPLLLLESAMPEHGHRGYGASEGGGAGTDAENLPLHYVCRPTDVSLQSMPLAPNVATSCAAAAQEQSSTSWSCTATLRAGQGTCRRRRSFHAVSGIKRHDSNISERSYRLPFISRSTNHRDFKHFKLVDEPSW